MGSPKRGAEFGRAASWRKPAAQLVRPEYSPDGPPVLDMPEAPQPCPMIKHLRAIGAPLFEDMPIRARRAPAPAPHILTSALRRRA